MIQATQEKPAQKETKSSSSSACCWVFGSLLLTGLIAGVLAWDTSRHGGVFERTTTGNFLKTTGALPYVQVAYTKTLSTSARGFKWAEANVPVYANKTCVVLTPYVLVAKDVGIIALNAAKSGWNVTKDYVVSKAPLVTSVVSNIYLFL